MEKRNTILLTVIAIATLLVSVVGATFAYFVASTDTTNTGDTVNATTQKMAGANLEFSPAEDAKFELLKYPGGLAVYGTKAVISKQDDSETNQDYEATFGLKIAYTNTTSTDLTWELYMVEDEFANLNAQATTICELKQKSAGTETHFWYGDKKESESVLDDTESCTGKAITDKLTGEKGSNDNLGGVKIASGKLKANEESGTITSATVGDEYEQLVNLSERKITTEAGHTTKYYYLVVKYPNENKNQSTTDAKQTISATLTIDGDPDVRLIPKAS